MGAKGGEHYTSSPAEGKKGKFRRKKIVYRERGRRGRKEYHTFVIGGSEPGCNEISAASEKREGGLKKNFYECK